RGLEVRARDPSGAQVLHARGVRVRVDALDLARKLARAALAGEGSIPVDLPLVAIGDVDVNVGAAPSGELRLARAFDPRATTGDEEAPEAADGRPVRVAIGAVRLEHARVHGAPRVDAD